MTTGLQISNGTDFDSLFQTGSGTQLLYTYANNGADIGQRYLPASSGSAYGNTGFYNPSGTDVGNLLCKAGSNIIYQFTGDSYKLTYKDDTKCVLWSNSSSTLMIDESAYKLYISVNNAFSRNVTQVFIGNFQLFPKTIYNTVYTINIPAGTSSYTYSNSYPIKYIQKTLDGTTLWNLANSSQVITFK